MHLWSCLQLPANQDKDLYEDDEPMHSVEEAPGNTGDQHVAAAASGQDRSSQTVAAAAGGQDLSSQTVAAAAGGQDLSSQTVAAADTKMASLEAVDGAAAAAAAAMPPPPVQSDENALESLSFDLLSVGRTDQVSQFGITPSEAQALEGLAPSPPPPPPPHGLPSGQPVPPPRKPTSSQQAKSCALCDQPIKGGKYRLCREHQKCFDCLSKQREVLKKKHGEASDEFQAYTKMWTLADTSLRDRSRGEYLDDVWREMNKNRKERDTER